MYCQCIFLFSLVGLCIVSIHILIKTKFAYLPESVAVVFLGCMIGAIIKLLQRYNLANWEVNICVCFFLNNSLSNLCQHLAMWVLTFYQTILAKSISCWHFFADMKEFKLGSLKNAFIEKLNNFSINYQKMIQFLSDGKKHQISQGILINKSVLQFIFLVLKKSEILHFSGLSRNLIFPTKILWANVDLILWIFQLILTCKLLLNFCS